MNWFSGLPRRYLTAAVAMATLAFSSRQARAQGFDLVWDSCGGSSFTFCSAVGVTSLSENVLRFSFWNYSGLDGTNSVASAGVYGAVISGLGGAVLSGPAVFRDPGAGFADALGVVKGGRTVKKQGWDCSGCTNPQLADGWLLYSRDARLSWQLQSLGLNALGSACDGGWGFDQQSSVQYFQTPCATPLNDRASADWVYFDAEFTAPVSVSTLTVAEVCAYSFGAVSCMTPGGDPTVVAEPPTWLLMLVGLSGIGISFWRVAQRPQHTFNQLQKSNE